MRYKLLGHTGLRVSELCLGTMTFGEDWGWGAPIGECRRMVETFAAAGGNFIDTANNYTGGTSETIVGELIRGAREQWVLATKYTLNVRPKDPNGGGNHRKNLVQALEASLKRLGTDYIDLYWVHAWDGLTPTDEVMRALDDVVRAGKVLYVGISDAPAWVVAQANTMAELRGWSRFAGLQIPYSLVERAPERDLLPMAKALDVGVAAWGALGAGVLTGKFRGGQRPEGTRLTDTPWGKTNLTPRNLEIAEVACQVADEIGATPTQVAVAWVRQRRFGPIVPILGARTLAQLEDNLAALKVTLDEAQIDRLDEVSAIDLGFPHDFLARLSGLIHGETRKLVDNHRA